MAVLTKQMLVDASALVSTELVEREITWTSGGSEHTATVYVKPMSYHAAVADLKSRDAVAGRIASSIYDDNGEPVFTEGDVTGEADPERGSLCQSLTMALLAVIAEVSGLAEKKTS